MSVKAKYNCKQVELYSVAMAGIHSFTEHQSAFEAFKAKYASPYETTLQNLLDTAVGIGSEQFRGMLSEEALIVLKGHAKKNLDDWQALKRYIRDVKAWALLQKPRLEAAGSMEFTKASNENWEYVKLLNDMAWLFITSFESELLADSNMPAGFKAQFETNKDDYAKFYNELMDKKQDGPEETALKVKANNELFEELMKMFDDGQYVMREQPATKVRFVFAQVLNKIRKPKGGSGDTGNGGPSVGQGELKGKVTSAAGGTGLAAQVTLSTENNDNTFEANSDGVYTTGTIRNGSYTVKVWEENHEQIEVTVSVSGTTVRDFVMTPLGE